MKKQYTQREVNQIFSYIPSRTLREWALKGFYKWVDEAEDARGTQRIFSELNLYQIMLVEILARNYFNAKDILYIMDKITKWKFKEEIHIFDKDNFLVITKGRKEPHKGKNINIDWIWIGKKNELINEFLAPLEHSDISVVVNLGLIKIHVNLLVNQNLYQTISLEKLGK